MLNNISILWILLVIFIALTIFGFAIFFSTKRPKKIKEEVRLDRNKIHSIFNSCVQKVSGSGNKGKYDSPWVVLLNEGGSNNRFPLEHLEILKSESSTATDDKRFLWHYFSKGTVIEFSSIALMDQDVTDSEEVRWEEFLKAVGSYKPRRPIDSIVVTIPAETLLKARENSEEKKKLMNLAQSTSRRIWLAQSRFAVRFPVYIVITGSEAISGFTSFSKGLPESMRTSILGWSSAYDLSERFSVSWVRKAIDEISNRISRLTTELAASDVRSEKRLEEFLLPLELSELKEILVSYTERLCDSNNFYEPFFFRGIFFVSDNNNQNFAKDLFDKKIFGEFGLLQASESQRFRRVLPNKFIKWIFILFVSFWSIGLVLATIKGNQVVSRLTEGIDGLNQDAKQRNEADRQGETLDFEWYRRTAVALILGLEDLESVRVKEGVIGNYGTIFMPGSLPVFDDLFINADKRIKKDFGELVINTLTRSLEQTTAKLTGSNFNQELGKLQYSEGNCIAPVLKKEKLVAVEGTSLKVNESPNLQSLQSFLNEAKSIEKAVKALKSLRYTSRTSSNEFRYLASYLLKVDLRGNLNGVTDLFAKSVRGKTEIIDTESISKALKCSLTEGVYQLSNEIFINNPLLIDEKKIIQAQDKYLNEETSNLSQLKIKSMLTTLVKSIENQELLLAQGGGLWMFKKNLDLGSDYDQLIAAIKENSLLGIKLSNQVKEKALKDFEQLKISYDSLTGSYGPLKPIIMKRDADGNMVLSLSEDRELLRNALRKILSKPIMSELIKEDIEYREVSPIANWDLSYLDSAILLKKYKNNFYKTELVRFPQQYREKIKESINYLIETKLVSYVASSYRPSPISSFSTDFDINNKSLFTYVDSLIKLKEVLSFMKELQQKEDFQKLKKIIVKDAEIRNKLIDNRLKKINKLLVKKDVVVSWDKSYLNQIKDLRTISSPDEIINTSLFEDFEKKEIESLLYIEPVLQTFYLIEKGFSPLGVDAYWENFNIRNESQKEYRENIQLLDEAKKYISRIDNSEYEEAIKQIIMFDSANRLGLLNKYISQKNYFFPRPSDVDRWDGKSNIIKNFYSVESLPQLRELINFQVTELKKISRLGRVYIQAISTDFSRKEKRKWDLIYSDLDNYEKKMPSDVGKIESFLISNLNNFSLDGCKQFNEEKFTSSGVDYFKEKLYKLRVAFGKKCTEVKQDEVVRKWIRASNNYNKLILGKRPITEKYSSNRPGFDYLEIDSINPEDLSKVLADFPTLDEILDVTSQSTRSLEFRLFYQHLEALRDTYYPFFLEKEVDEKSYQVEILFRRNRETELFGDKIIDWSIEISDKKIDMYGGDKFLKWSYGDKILMKLRFASDTDIAPYLLEKSPYYSVVGKKVIYRYDDPWALFDMMNAHGIGSEKSSIGQILKFEFPVRLKDGSTENENIDLNARIFLELRLRSSHDNKRLKFRGTTRIEPPLL